MNWLLIIGAVIVANIVVFLLFPPFDKSDPSAACAYPVCFINGTLELPAPHVVWPVGHHAPAELITWEATGLRSA